MGFSRCVGETEMLVDVVTEIENNAVYRFSIDGPMRSVISGEECYFYTKLRLIQTRVTGMEELLFPLRRPSENGLLLLVQSEDVPIASARRWGEMMHPGIRDWPPKELVFIDIPSAVDVGPIVAAFGPPHSALFELIDESTLEALGRAGDCGVATITCRGRWCSLASAGPRKTLGLGKLLPTVEKLIRARAVLRCEQADTNGQADALS
jgi:hypothetical protein